MKFWIFEKKNKYKYTLTEDVTVFSEDYTNIHIIKYSNKKEMLLVICDGLITVKKGYAWNGCTGVTDGKNDECKLASCLHDVLYQFKVGKRKDADILFRQLLHLAKWKYTKLYYLGVRLFGLPYWIIKN
ncbi:MAG: hypothetical protein HC892_01435 [Saprospiraceae bacterium]|nr:hypothetical protein [Saprospiraceae bacterium]